MSGLQTLSIIQAHPEGGTSVVLIDLVITEPPPFLLSIFVMSARSAYCTSAGEARFFASIAGEL